MKRIVLLLAALLTGCVDLEGAHQRCLDDGRCFTDAGTVTQDAGSDAGADGGVDAGVAYDGGTPCTGSPNPRLRCGTPIELGTGAGIYGGQIVANNQSFIVGWNTANSIELRSVTPTGTVSQLKTVSGITDARFAIDARGNGWALIYQDGTASALTCATDAVPGGATVQVKNGGMVDYPIIALSSSGGVGVSALPSSGTGSVKVYGGHSTSGCPAEIIPFAGTDGWNSASVVPTSASGGDGFRYVSSSQINAFNGSVEMMRLEPDGGVLETNIVLEPGFAPDALAASPSVSGQTVIVAYLQVTSTGYSLGHVNTSADLSGDGTPTTIFSGDPGFWATMSCGAGCAGVTWLNFHDPGPATVAFVGDDPSAAPKGRYDILCALQPYETATQSIGSAYLAGKVAVVHTTSSTARLYLCDLPPL